MVCNVLEELVGGEDAVADGAEIGESIPSASTDEENEKLTPASATTRIRAFGRALAAEVFVAALALAAAQDININHTAYPFLECALGTFGPRTFTFGSGAVAAKADELLSNRAYALLLTAPSLLFAYLRHRGVPRRGQVYRALLSEVARHPEGAGDALGALVGPGSDADWAGGALEGLSVTEEAGAGEGPLDALFVGSAEGLDLPPRILGQVLQHSGRFLTPAAGRAVLSRVVGAFVGRVEAALAFGQRVALGEFAAGLALLADVLGARPDALAGAEEGALFPAMYIFAYVLPRAYSEEERERDNGAVKMARGLWTRWCAVGGDEAVRREVGSEVTRRLAVLVCSTDVCVECVLFSCSDPFLSLNAL